AGALRLASSLWAARGTAAVRRAIEAGAAVRLPGPGPQPRGRAIHAALLPHGDRALPSQRNAARTAGGKDPAGGRRTGRAVQRALPTAPWLHRDHAPERVPRVAVGAA